MDKVVLKVGGLAYEGWKEIDVKKSLEQIAGTFDIVLTERWPSQKTAWVIASGEQCALELNDNVVISGYVDSVAVSYDAQSHEIKVAGRDKTGDLVDCSAPSTAFANLTFEQIATKLCQPFGITVYDETVSGKKISTKQKKAGKKGNAPKKPRLGSKLPKSACQNGETVFKTLEKLARSEGVLLVSDNEGGLLITRAALAGDCQTILKLGDNILSASYEQSNIGLFSEITVKGQVSGEDAARFDIVHTSAKGKVQRQVTTIKSSMINRYRPLIIVAESQADSKRCQQRASWEASNREARARRVKVTVQGWIEPATGELWEINKRVKVECEWMRLDEWWLISSLNFKLSDSGGTTTELSLVSEKSFDELPEIPEPQQAANVGNRFKLTAVKK